MVSLILLLTACSTKDEVFSSSGQLQVLSYNIHGLPPAITDDDTTARVEAIAPLLQNYDLIGIQEDWMLENHDLLLSGSGFPHNDYFDEVLDDSKVYGAGLTWLSNHALQNIEHHFYDDCHGTVDNASDCLASKGIQQATITMDGSTITILNTHLEAGNGDTDQGIRQAQIEHIISLDVKTPVILMGDFNLHPEDDADLAILEQLESIGGFQNACWVLDCPEPNHIDQIWFRSNESISLTALSWSRPTDFVDDNGVPLSDHPPIAANIQWDVLE